MTKTENLEKFSTNLGLETLKKIINLSTELKNLVIQSDPLYERGINFCSILESALIPYQGKLY